MADNRKYYYLKLKESYFDDDSPPSGKSTSSGYPSTWPPLARRTRAMPPPFAAG